MATWQDAGGTNCCNGIVQKKYGNAEAKAMAIEHWAWMIWSFPHYREALQLDGPQS